MNILKSSKRILAMLLCAVMVFSMLPVQAFATEEAGTDTPTAVTVTGVALDQYVLDLTVGDSAVLTATVSPEEVSDKRVTWTSDNEAVATVTDGTVTAVAEGTANIIATTAAGGYTATCIVTVSPAQAENPSTPELPETPEADTVAVTGITLDQESLSVPLGGYSTLTYTIAPENATNQNVIWSSSDEAVATVADGQVTGVAEGTAVITVTAADGGFSASVEATVVMVKSRASRSTVTVTEITNADDLAAIISTNSGSYRLTSDIELPNNWTPKDLGAYLSETQIIFDGNGHTITLNGTSLFAGVYTPCTVKNLVIKGNVSASGAAGAIATSLSGTIINCISYAEVVSTDNNAGGLVGTVYDGAHITNSAVLGNVSTEYAYAASYAIYAGRSWEATATVTDCYWIQDIAASENDDGKYGKKDSTSAVIEAVNTANASDSTLTVWTVESNSDAARPDEDAVVSPNLDSFALVNSSNIDYAIEVAELNFDSVTPTYRTTLSSYSTSYAYIHATFAEGLTATYEVGSKTGTLTSGVIDQWFSFGDEGTTTTLTVTVTDETNSTVYTFDILRPARSLEDDNTLSTYYGGIVVKYGANYTNTTIYQADSSGNVTENAEQSNDHKYYAAVLPEGETSFVVTASATGSYAKVRYCVDGGDWETWGNWSAPNKTVPARVDIQIISEKEYYSGTEGWDGKNVNSFTLWVKTVQTEVVTAPQLEDFVFSQSMVDYTFNPETYTYDVALASTSANYSYLTATFADGYTVTYTHNNGADTGELTSGEQNKWINFSTPGTTVLVVTVSDGTNSTDYTFNITLNEPERENDNTLGIGWGGIIVKYGSSYTQATVYQADASGNTTESTTQSNDHKYYTAVLPEGEISFVVTASANGSNASVRYRVNEGDWETWGNWSAPSKTTPAKVEIQIISEKEYYSGTEGWDGKTVNSFTLWVKTEGAVEAPKLASVTLSNMEAWTFDPEVFTYDLIATQGYTTLGYTADETYTVTVTTSATAFSSTMYGLSTGTTPFVITVSDGKNTAAYTFNLIVYENAATALGGLTVSGAAVVQATDQGVVQEGTATTEQQKHYATTISADTSSFTFTARSVRDTSYLRYRADENTDWSDAAQGSLTGTVAIDMDSQIAVQIQISSDSTFADPNTYTLWATRGTPASDGTWEGSGTAADPYLLQTTEDLEALRNQTNAGNAFSGVYFRMTTNISLPSGWTVIGNTSSTPFSGNLDGNNKTLTVPEGGKPLLGYVNGAVVTNLNIYGTRINGYGLVDNFIGFTSTTGITLDNVTLKSGSSTLKSGLLGSYITTNQYAGCGANFVVEISNCTIERNVVIGYNKDQSQVGAIAGRVNGTITNCTSYATVYGVDYVGGIVGMKDNALANLVVSNCTFDGTVSASGTHAGGIAGGIYNDVSAPNGTRMKILDCENKGSVTGTDKVGGILGGDSIVLQSWDNSSISEISGNTSTGTITATGGTYAGGIIGYYHSLNKYDNISGNTYSGTDKGIGFVQYVDTSCTTHETASGATYFNTAEDLPGITVDGGKGGVTKRNHNRTDDPIGADAETLTKYVGTTPSTPSTPTVTKLTVDTSKCTLRYNQGENYDLTGAVFTATWSDGKTTNPALSEVTITGYDPQKSGTQTLTATYEGIKCYITVNVIAAVTNTTITVTFSMLGDSAHGDNGSIHTLKNGGLTTWVSATQYTMSTGSTVQDLIAKVCGNNGMSYSIVNGYIYSVTRNGVTLTDSTNGAYCGWMYTINGAYSDYSVSEQKLSNGDVVVFHYTDDYNVEYGSSSSGGTVTITKTDAEKVIDLITAIGTVSYTDTCKAKIDAAREAYNALSATEKAKVTNITTLEAAETSYANLKKLDDQKQADAVDALINKIDETITLDSEPEITAAREAFNKLTKEQQALVKNLQKLRDAENALAALKASDEDKEKAKAVVDLIEQIGEVTLDSEEKIKSARTAYDKLTDLQKALVTNIDVLEAAETALARLKELTDFQDAYKTTGEFLFGQELPIGSDWIVLGLIRSGYAVEEDYYQQLVTYIQENADENTRLHSSKSSDNSRTILALTAMGYDATDVQGYNLITGLNSMDYVLKQGINGAFWALIALDSGNYPAPGGEVTRDSLIQTILEAQLTDGGWALSGETSDPDMTGMALQALAPYYDAEAETTSDVNEAVEDALAYLSRIQNSDGSFSTGDTATAESIAQVIVALTALGIDPDTDERFIKNDCSALDALLTFYVSGGGFRHVMDGTVNGVATEQAYYALTAYERFLKGDNRLYDMTDILDKGGDIPTEETAEEAVTADTAETAAQEKPGFFQWLLNGIQNLLSWFTK